MAWTTPLTAVANTALTAAQWNASVRDNFNASSVANFSAASQIWVSTAANAGAVRTPTADMIATTQSTASTSYTNLTTVGPTVSVDTGAASFVTYHGRQSNATAGQNVWTSYAVATVSTVAAADDNALSYDSSGTAGSTVYHGTSHLVTGLTPGTNVFVAKYRVSGGTGSFANRRLAVIPL